MSRQKQMFERSSQRKRSDFEQMKKNFNMNSIETSEQMPSDRSSERERRERREDDRDVRRDTRVDARDVRVALAYYS